MTVAAQERAGALVWSLPRARWPYVVGFAVLTVGFTLLYVAFLALSGYEGPILAPDEPLGLESSMRTNLVIGALLAFLLTALLYERSRDDLEQLRRHTGMTSAEFAARVLPAPAPKGRVWLAVGVGAIVGVGMIPASSADPLFFLKASNWEASLLWSLVLNALLFGLLGQATYQILRLRGMEDRIVEALPPLDLLDRSPFAPFSRMGLRRAFYWAGGSSIASLLALDIERVGPLFGIIALTLAFSSLALLAPARAIRRRIAQTKRLELERVRERISRAKERALGSGVADDPDASDLPGLLAWEARLLEVSEWPFDTGTRLRFAGVVLLVVGSWLGGAMVERVLGLVLG